jgi:hypothetical protein
MNKAQYQREKLLAAARIREAELRLLSESRKSADTHYVQDVVDWLWSKILDRKLRMRDSLSLDERERLMTLEDLCA